MAKNGKKKNHGGQYELRPKNSRLHPETKKSVWAIVLIGIAILFVLAGIGKAGPAGTLIYTSLEIVVGWGYFMIPAILLLVSGVFLFSHRERFIGITAIGAVIIGLSALGILELTGSSRGGWLGFILGSLKIPFGVPAAAVLDIVILCIGIIITLNVPLRFRLPGRKKQENVAPVITGVGKEESGKPEGGEEEKKLQEKTFSQDKMHTARPPAEKKIKALARNFKNYVAPPLSLLQSSDEKPTTGDLRANANIIKRTLESFGITVEMGEINIGPKVTRYTLKPAEGMKLSKITALHQDLSLALAAHPIRIEAPIPGKSLVGIEVPNKAAALVRLGNLINYQEFQKSGLLGFSLGRDVTGEPIFADIERMPHLLVAGATGSGKSVMIHSILISLLYKNSPETLRLILVDPKRVELSMYENIPHLISPVVTESKKAVNVFRWAIKEMERRYDVLLKAGVRDIKSYNANLSDRQAGGDAEEPLPYLLMVVDELADLMTSYGREVEGSIIRLAQMARATGLHLILSTQRPSVEVITGLIKANITSRIALQVASQVDSRTILDTSGAEKLLGGGDLLFVSAELSKPKRIQGAYVSEEEANKVADFIRENNAGQNTESEGISFENGTSEAFPGEIFDEETSGDDDELYDEALNVVREAKKASASLLQRRLKVGYARAARLLDIMEANGVIGPGEGAKPREVFIEKNGEEV